MKMMALSREITLTIDNYNITLDKEIKIYEYDAINLCFTIQEYGIVMRDGKAHNRVMPVVALKAYMLIETPQGVDSVEATNIVRNKVIFSLGNKYSQFVGVGKMQIILRDLDGCRITLPEFNYEVKQSINTGWEMPDVLIGEKDFVVTDELGRPVETTKISEMDEVNEITPQTYTMVINEDGNKKIKLDTIMESISETNVEEIDRRIDEMIEVYDDEEIEVEFPSLHNDVERIKGEINEISESLDKKVNESEVVKKGYGTLNDFDEETRRKILGLSVTEINAVLGYQNVIPENTNFIDTGDNKIDISRFQKGYLDHTNGEFIPENSDFITSHFIKVNANDILHIKEFQNHYPIVFVRVCEYDNSENFIKYIDINANTYTVENNGFIRFYSYISQTINNDSKPMVTINKEANVYEPFKYIFNTSLVNIPKEIEKTKWYNKKGCAFGDSITQQGTVEELNGWQVLLNNKLGLYHMWNCGIGGSTVCGNQPNAMHLDERINAIPSDSDFIIFMGGTNDWLQNKPLGDINSKDVTTFYGALNVIVEKLFNRCPQATILFCGTPYGKTTLNITSGLTQRDYANCIRNIAEKYGIKYIDTMSEMECNVFNISYFYQYEDGNYIHPNVKGGQRIYEMMLKGLLY